MYWLILIIIAVLVAGAMFSIFKEKNIPAGYWTVLISTLIGGFLGERLLGDWLWLLADFNVIAGIIGAAIIAWIYIIIVDKNTPEAKA